MKEINELKVGIVIPTFNGGKVWHKVAKKNC
jgi:hypothetical protein